MLGDRIAASRRLKGLTQVEFAPLIGVTPMTVSYYERGAWPVPASRLARIAEVLDDPSLLQASEEPETLRAGSGENGRAL